jgi:hypothetical protein
MARKKRLKQMSLEDIHAVQSLARSLRKTLEIHDRAAPNVLQVFEQLKRLFPKLKLRVVPDSALKQPARANPRNWTIRIRQSLYEALLRGQWLARWTLCHELAHVLRAHPGMPFREQSYEKRKSWREREANVFVTEFLIPPHLAAKCDTAEAISRTFQVSADAAEIAHFESERDRGRLFSPFEGTRKSALATQKKRSYYSSIEDQAAAINLAIFLTTAEARARSLPVEAFRNNPISAANLTAVGSRLLLDAYNSFSRSVGASKFISEATLVAAILYLCPIREIGEARLPTKDILGFNQICAQFAVKKLLKIGRSVDVVLPYPDDPISFKSSYLDSLLGLGEQQIQNATTILCVPNLPDYKLYNAENDIAWGDIHYIERLMDSLFLLVDDS